MSTVKINELGAGTPISTDLVPFADPTTGLAEKATLTQVASVVEPLLTGKADLNGNSSEQFEVADATSSTQAVSKNQLDVAINALQGSLIPQGNWNASTNTPDITGTTTTGYYWIVSVDGSTNLDGITDWKVNDWAIKTATGWAKIDNSEPVTSVAGKTGAVTLDLNDVSDSATRFALTNTTQSINGAKTFSSLLTANGGVTSDGDLDLTADGKVNVAKTLTTLDQKVTGEVQATSFVGDGSKLRNVQIESPATPSDQQLSYGNSEMQNYLRVQDAAGRNVDAPNSGGWTIAKDKKIGIRPSIRFIPSAIKTNILPSQLPRNGNGNFTFARTSTAQTVHFDGFIVTTGSGSPRIDYLDGEESLLLEPASTNLIPYSEEFDNSAWTKTNATVTANSVLSPDGSVNADTLTEDSATGAHRLNDSIIISSSGIPVTQSVFAKSKGDGRFLRIFRGTPSNNLGVFDLDNGVVYSSGGTNLLNAKIEDYGNGWYRCSITFTSVFTNIATYFGLQNGDLDSYAGDGTSGIYIFGAQLEQLSYPTSYIRTEGSQVTRIADAVPGNSSLGQVINSSEGVLYFEGSCLVDAGTDRRISLSDGSADVYRLTFDSSGNIFAVAYVGGSNQCVLTFNADLTQNLKCAFKYKENDFSLWVNGVEVGADPSGSVSSSMNKLSLDAGSSSVAKFFGKIRELKVYDTALTDAELTVLTS